MEYFLYFLYIFLAWVILKIILPVIRHFLTAWEYFWLVKTKCYNDKIIKHLQNLRDNFIKWSKK